MTWTADKIKTLKKLWQKGKSTVEIGRELGISKNAVVGKVHRLELNSRPSPIKKEVIVKVVKQKVVKTDKMSLLDLKLNSCRWPIGDPKDADFHFCGKDTVTGKPYCNEHCKVAYTSLKELASQKADAKKDLSDEDDIKIAKKTSKKEEAKSGKETAKKTAVKSVKPQSKNDKKESAPAKATKVQKPAKPIKAVKNVTVPTKPTKAAKAPAKPAPKAKVKKK